MFGYEDKLLTNMAGLLKVSSEFPQLLNDFVYLQFGRFGGS